MSKIRVELIDHCGSDLSVVIAARASFSKQSELIDGIMLSIKDEKLIQYLARHKHFSPFNHSFLSFRVKAPIFVARQLVKHKFLPWNEESRRYIDDTPEFFYPEDGWRLAAENVKQGSSDSILDYLPEIKTGTEYNGEVRLGGELGAVKEFYEIALDLYNGLLKAGVAPEQARMVLPLSTMTTWIWSGTLGAMMGMLELRLDKHAQKETRDVAHLIAKEIKELFPVSFSALLNNFQ